MLARSAWLVDSLGCGLASWGHLVTLAIADDLSKLSCAMSSTIGLPPVPGAPAPVARKDRSSREAQHKVGGGGESVAPGAAHWTTAR